MQVICVSQMVKETESVFNDDSFGKRNNAVLIGEMFIGQLQRKMLKN